MMALILPVKHSSTPAINQPTSRSLLLFYTASIRVKPSKTYFLPHFLTF